MKEILSSLKNEAGAAISYRVRAELLCEKMNTFEVAREKEHIVETERIQRVLSWQNKDGRFGTRLHTPPSKSKVWSHEGCVRFLLESGLDTDWEPLNRAMMVLLTPEWKMECQNSRAANILDTELLRAALFAQAGLHEYDFVGEWVHRCLELYSNVASAYSYDDLTYEDKKGNLIFRDNQPVPAVYHMRILAYTNEWRSKENYQMLRHAFDNLAKWIPMPSTTCKSGSQLIAPFGSMNVPLMTQLEETNGFWWLHYRELMARMGVLNEGSPFWGHFASYNFDELFAELSETRLWFKKSYMKNGYINWSGYGGMALEGDWRDREQQIRDLAFRFCLIKHYSMNA